MLGSPTRQAVNLARSYDARERKLQMQAQSRGEASGADEPAYVRMIGQLRTQAAALGAPVAKVPLPVPPMMPMVSPLRM